MRAGHEIRVCLTDSASRFVTPLLFETLTGNPCLLDTFEEPVRGRMAHIDWARQADLILLAPASANTIIKIANGIADDMLTTVVLASEAPLLICPAMNPSMFLSEPVRAARSTLLDRGVFLVEPTEGDVVAGEAGVGKLAPNAEIAEWAESLLKKSKALAGKRVLITSGPTEEPIDDVRFLTNRSSGKMGSAIAFASQRMGADVTVIAGPQSASFPRNVNVIRVQTAAEMLDAGLRAGEAWDWIIGVAAVADYRPANPVSGKIRRSDSILKLELAPNPDVISSLAKAFPNASTVAFAAEPTDNLETVRQKLDRKGAIAIAANNVTREGIGFGSDQNEVQLVFRDGRTVASGTQSKLKLAFWLWEQLLAHTTQTDEEPCH
jgi:phosphopantothenoylcysteine decarboxylase/phosphopantothenate--cysteine ligase